jgi:putative peptidoglycan lipid II flippase
MSYRYLISAVFSVGIITLSVRALGLVRDGLLATAIGLSSEVDLFFLVLGWANFFTSVFAISAISLMIPKVRSFFDKSDQDQITNLVAQVFAGFFAIGLSIGVVGGVFINEELGVIFCGALIFITQSINHFGAAVLNLKQHFVRPAMLFVFPIGINIVALLYGISNAFSLLVLFFIGTVIQTAILLLYLSKYIGIRKILTLKSMVTPTQATYLSWLGLAIATLYFPASELLTIQLAAFIGDGEVALIGYAARVPIALSGIIIFAGWTVGLPHMETTTRQILSSEDLKRALLLTMASGGVAVLVYWLSPWLVATIYGQGKNLSSDSLTEITRIQRLFLVAVPLQVLMNLLLRFMHANDKMKLSIFLGTLGILTQVVLFFIMGESSASIAYGFMGNFTVVLVAVLISAVIASRRKRHL